MRGRRVPQVAIDLAHHVKHLRSQLRIFGQSGFDFL